MLIIHIGKKRIFMSICQFWNVWQYRHWISVSHCRDFTQINVYFFHFSWLCIEMSLSIHQGCLFYESHNYINNRQVQNLVPRQIMGYPIITLFFYHCWLVNGINMFAQIVWSLQVFSSSLFTFSTPCLIPSSNPGLPTTTFAFLLSHLVKANLVYYRNLPIYMYMHISFNMPYNKPCL